MRSRRALVARAAGALVAAVAPLLPGPLTGQDPAAIAGVSTPHGVAPGELPVAVTIERIDPVAPQPHTEVRVTAVVTNHGVAALDHYDVELRLAYEPLHSRGELALAEADDSHFRSDVPVGGRVDSTGPLAPGASTTVTLRLTPDTAKAQQGLLDEYGVYRLGVEVHDADTGNAVVGIRNTLLPWLPADGYGPDGWAPVRIAWLWPVTDRPRGVPGAGGADQDRAGPDEPALVAELTRGARLDRLLSLATRAAHQHGSVRLPIPPPPPPAPDAATRQRRDKPAGRTSRQPPPPRPTLAVRSAPVTYGVDPALLETLAALGRSKRPGHGVAAGYLDRLRTQVTTDNLIALPYADPDVSALVRAGADGQLRNADNARDAVLADTGFPRTVLGVSWPPGGFVSPAALTRLTAPYVVLDESAAPPVTLRSYTPDMATRIARPGGPITALLSDDRLVELATTPVSSETQALVRQRFAAETAMIVAERPGLSRTVLVALPHGFDPTGTAAGNLLRDSGRLPWVDPVSIGTAVASPADPTSIRAGVRYPAWARAAELPADYVSGIETTGGAVRDLRSLLCPQSPGSSDPGCRPDSLALPLEHALLACASAAWRGDLADGRRLLAATADRTRNLLGKVRITTAGTVTLVSQSGSIPITIANDLPLPVTIRLDITTPNQSQLRVDARRLFVVPSGAKAQQTIEARTSSAGKAKFPIYVQLRTPDGSLVGDRTELVVRSSAYGIVAVGITAGALVLLFGAVAVRVTRTAIRARRRADHAR